MFDAIAPDRFACPLQANAYWHLIRKLRLALPRPPGDSAEDLLRRDHAAIAQIAALVPANAVEANLAAQFVAASEQWMEWLRLAQDRDAKPQGAANCRTRALGMMRQANNALRLLQRMQEARGKLETDSAACDRRAGTEQVAARLITEAVAAPPATPPPASEPQPEPSEAPPGSSPGSNPGSSAGEAPAEAGAPPALSGAAASRWLAEHDPELIAAAERYAAAHPERAASIRRTGKMPPGDVRYFDPPEASLAPALIAGRTPALLALDDAFPKGGAG